MTNKEIQLIIKQAVKEAREEQSRKFTSKLKTSLTLTQPQMRGFTN